MLRCRLQQWPFNCKKLVVGLRSGGTCGFLIKNGSEVKNSIDFGAIGVGLWKKVNLLGLIEENFE